MAAKNPVIDLGLEVGLAEALGAPAFLEDFFGILGFLATLPGGARTVTATFLLPFRFLFDLFLPDVLGFGLEADCLAEALVLLGTATVEVFELDGLTGLVSLGRSCCVRAASRMRFSKACLSDSASSS